MLASSNKIVVGTWARLPAGKQSFSHHSGDTCPLLDSNRFQTVLSEKVDGVTRVVDCQGFCFLIVEAIAKTVEFIGLRQPRPTDPDIATAPFCSNINWSEPEPWYNMKHDCGRDDN